MFYLHRLGGCGSPKGFVPSLLTPLPPKIATSSNRAQSAWRSVKLATSHRQN
jgi:hypothetical protein